MAETNSPESASVRAGYETSDLSPRAIALFGLGLALTVIVVMLITYGLWVLFRDSEARRAAWLSPLSSMPDPITAPRLEIEPGRELKALRREEEARLNSYGWVDREKGLAHIPIDRAIEILAEKGLPTRPSKARPQQDRAKKTDAVRQEPQS
jgi:hypothetical protein